jgi:flagellar motor protein MotB
VLDLALFVLLTMQGYIGEGHLMSVSNYLRELKRVQKRGAQLTQKRADLLQKMQQLEQDVEKNEQETKENAQEEERILLQLRQDIDGRLQQRGQEEGQVRPHCGWV